MSDPHEPGFSHHRFALSPGQRHGIPDTEYEVAVPNQGVTRESYERDGQSHSVVTCRLEVFERGARVHTELVAEGETAWFRDLEVRVVGSTETGEAELEVVRAPYTSIPPRSAE
jgi:hypothetical protein